MSRDDPADRRNLLLGLTVAGQVLVDRVMDDRRAAITDILGRMPDGDRRRLAPVLDMFAAAADEVSENIAWSSGWPTPGQRDGAGGEPRPPGRSAPRGRW